MLYLLAIFFPPLAVLIAGKPFQAIINFFLIFLLYLPAVIHAFGVVNNYYADKRAKRIAEAVQERSKD